MKCELAWACCAIRLHSKPMRQHKKNSRYQVFLCEIADTTLCDCTNKVLTEIGGSGAQSENTKSRGKIAGQKKNQCQAATDRLHLSS